MVSVTTRGDVPVKRLLIFLLLCLTGFSGSIAMAENTTGLYYDSGRDGEGIALFNRDDRFENTVQFTFFTYIERCNVTAFDEEGEAIEALLDALSEFEFDEEEDANLLDLINDLEEYDHCRNVQVWYTSGLRSLATGEAFGELYITDPFDRSGNPLAELSSVGLFLLDQTDEGFDLKVLKTGDELSVDAELYNRDYEFEYLYGPSRTTHTVEP